MVLDPGSTEARTGSGPEPFNQKRPFPFPFVPANHPLVRHDVSGPPAESRGNCSISGMSRGCSAPGSNRTASHDRISREAPECARRAKSPQSLLSNLGNNWNACCYFTAAAMVKMAPASLVQGLPSLPDSRINRSVAPTFNLHTVQSAPLCSTFMGRIKRL